MNYFKALGLIFGLAAFLKPVYMHLLPWDENTFIEKFYSEKRPAWIVPLAILGLLMIAFTWYLHLTLEIPYSIYVTVLFSLTGVKALTFLFDYSKFQTMVAKMLKKEKGRDIILIDIGAGIFGAVVLVLTFMYY